MNAEGIETIRAFYVANRQALYTYALACTHSREGAEDVLQTVFTRLLKRPRQPRNLRPYVFRMVRNAAIDLHRAQARRLQRDTIFAIDDRRDNGHDPGLQHELADSLARLNENEREAVVLKIYNGLTFDEIAQTRRVSINTAASWYRRGLQKLRGYVKEDSS